MTAKLVLGISPRDDPAMIVEKNVAVVRNDDGETLTLHEELEKRLLVTNLVVVQGTEAVSAVNFSSLTLVAICLELIASFACSVPGRGGALDRKSEQTM